MYLLDRSNKELIVNRKNKDEGLRDYFNLGGKFVEKVYMFLYRYIEKGKDFINVLIKFNGNNSEDSL